MIETNAKIRSTFLGREDHGIFTFVIEVEHASGSHQGVGRWCLSDCKHLGVSAGAMISRLLDVVGVYNWEKLRGTPVRVRRERDGNVPVVAIGHYLKDEWLHFADFAKQIAEDKKELEAP